MPFPLPLRQGALGITGPDALALRQEPDLQQVGLLNRLGIDLGMGHTTSGRHPLDVLVAASGQVHQDRLVVAHAG